MNKVVYRLSNGNIVNTYAQAENSEHEYTKEYVKVEDEYKVDPKKVLARIAARQARRGNVKNHG